MIRTLANLFYRVQERMLGRQTYTVLNELRASQWWPREKLDALRLERLQNVVRSAWEHSAYWRQVMQSRGIQPSDIQSLDDVRRFPLLDKAAIREHREDMVRRDNATRLGLVTTSGSTNEALRFYSCSEREAHINAARMRGHEWIGIFKGDREMYVWGSPIELSKQDQMRKVRDWLINDALTNGFEVRPEALAEIVAYWMHWRPECIFGYPNCLALVARTAQAMHIPLHQLRDRGLRAICTTSEMLTDLDRRLIHEGFQVPVYDSYGLREGGLIGHECDRCVMHTIDEQLLLETIDPQTLAPTADEGELVITNLFSTVMPMIRYRTGDIVKLSSEPCGCGRSLGSIKISGGRVADFILTQDGRWISAYALIYVCRSVKGIVKFQAQQDQPGEVRLLLVTDADFPADGAERVAEKVRDRLGSGERVLVTIVDEIQPAPSGKYRPVIGTLAQQRLQAATLTSCAAPPEKCREDQE